VNSGGTLGGSGTFSGAGILNSGGTIAPGAGNPGVAGTVLHGKSLTWNGGGALSLQISSGSIEDALALSGALTKGTSGTFTIAISGNGAVGEAYTLATFGSTTFASSDFKLELPEGYTGHLVETATSLTLDLDSFVPPAFVASAMFVDTNAVSENLLTPNQAVAQGNSGGSLSVTPAPEPGSALLLALSAGAVLGWRRRRA
jgi:hypothetical protein